ncbi:uncharacterized protein [Coffea arabica]|uniref:Reverse transcriptase domain-containing protein n=1 Tax=Coffea arabica TaxID=13443 RepID=A0ABM4X9I7_COFAR
MTEDELVGVEAVRYFSTLFSREEDSSSSATLGVIPRLLSEVDNVVLQEVPSIEEVGQDIIGEDVYRVVQSFFCGEELPSRVSATSLVLLAKVARPKDFSEFRSISLCNFVNKIISKLLANHLASVLLKIISENQSGFVRGRLISDNYLLAQELISSIGWAARGGNVALKLDMMKAYDRVVWPFLINVLRAFGFGERWIDMVWRLISNVWFSVIVNESSYGFFKSTWGLRQGDPLSPALFIIGAEVLSRSLNKLQSHRGFQGFRVPRECPLVSHLGYADDVLVFSSAVMKSLKLVKWVLTDYEAVFGQRINARKSYFLVHLTASPSKRLGIQRGGRIVLLKHVLSAMPTYLLMAVSPPKAIFKELEGIGALADQLDSVLNHKVAEFVQGGSWDVRRISQWHHSGPSPLFNRIWHPGVPLRVSFFLLCLLRDRLPLDCSVWKLGIQGPSRCLCCPSPEIETTEHLFGDGVLAQYVWRFFGAPVGVGWSGSSFLVCMAAWWEGRQRNKFLRFVHQVVPLMICWHLWKARNGMKYEGKRIVGAQDPVSGLPGSVVVVDPVPFGHISMETGGLT